MDIPCQFCNKKEAQLFFKYNDYEQIRAMCRLCYINDKDDLADGFNHHGITEIEAEDYVVHLVMDT